MGGSTCERSAGGLPIRTCIIRPMKEAPTFLRDEADPVEPETVLRPALAPRRGEWIAWLCTLGTAIGSLILMAKSGAVPALGVGLTLFFLLAAGLISYGNWIDRSTEIRWNDSGIEFHSPLRSVVLPWGRVDAMWAVPTARSWRIAVRFHSVRLIPIVGCRLPARGGAGCHHSPAGRPWPGWVG
jgi:hypothetical protein